MLSTLRTCRTFKVTYADILPWIAAYVALPVLIFYLAWLRMPWNILGTFLVCGAYVCVAGRPRRIFDRLGQRVDSASAGGMVAPKYLELSWPILVVLILIAVAWCFFGGQGGLWYQSSDWDCRNAVLRDLVFRPWPVYYPAEHAAMSYYVGFWLPSAAVAKLCLRLGFSAVMVWRIARYALYAWTALGIVCVFVLVGITLNVHSARAKRGAVALALAMVFFAMPDVLGLFASASLELWRSVVSDLHLEWWAFGSNGVTIGQYSSLTTDLFWVFNQTVISWICTLCFLNERDFRSYFFLFLCCFVSGPLPAVGLALMMVVQGIGRVMSARRVGEGMGKLLCTTLSPQNAMSLALLPIVALFFLANSSATGGAALQALHNLVQYPLWLPADVEDALAVGRLLLCEAAPLVVLVAPWERRKPEFWGVAVVLAVCPFVRLGSGADFCMRASIPAILVLFVLCMDTLRGGIARWAEAAARQRVLTVVLCGVLALGAATPLVEFARGFRAVAHEGLHAGVHDGYSLTDLQDFSNSNFGLRNPEDAAFFRWFAG